MAPSPNVSDFASFRSLISLSANEEKYCIWHLTKKTRACRNTLNKLDRTKAFELGATIRRNLHQVQPEQLKEYARLNCCNNHHRRALLADRQLQELLVKRWMSELYQEESTPSEPEVSLSLPAIACADDTQETQFQLDCRIIQTRSRSQRSSQTGTSSQLTDITDLSSSPFRPRIVPRYHSILAKLRDTPKSSPKTGTIYLFTRESSPGFIKIGYTKWAAQCRLRDWERSCGYKPLLVASFDDVPYMQRVEQLIHFELADAWRVEKRCAKCSRKHQEWFELQSEKAVSVAEQWVEWIKKAEPYDLYGRLKSAWIDELRDLEARGISVTAEVLLDLHSKLLQPEPTLRELVIEETPEPETQPADEQLADINLPTTANTDIPMYTDAFTAEPDLCSSRAETQSQSQCQSSSALSQIQILTNCLSTMLMIIRVFAQLSPDVFRLLMESCAAGSIASQSSVISSTRQASMISSRST